MRSIRHKEIHHHAAGRSYRRYRQHDAFPWQITTQPADEVRQRCADHQRSDEKAKGVSEVPLVPTSRDLHADRIDASEA